MDIFQFRNEYLKGGLERSDLDDNPFKQFEKWFNHAVECKVKEPNAMAVSTVDENGAPTSRVVLLKSYSTPTTTAKRRRTWRKTPASAPSSSGSTSNAS